MLQQRKRLAAPAFAAAAVQRHAAVTCNGGVLAILLLPRCCSSLLSRALQVLNLFYTIRGRSVMRPVGLLCRWQSLSSSSCGKVSILCCSSTWCRPESDVQVLCRKLCGITIYVLSWCLIGPYPTTISTTFCTILNKVPAHLHRCFDATRCCSDDTFMKHAARLSHVLPLTPELFTNHLLLLLALTAWPSTKNRQGYCTVSNFLILEGSVILTSSEVHTQANTHSGAQHGDM